ncbi:major facilitator superfamily domain-containing protein [Melampsora americana]|nr:major facilitator superfamily domain-containing protein [Melampsora americana]
MTTTKANPSSIPISVAVADQLISRYGNDAPSPSPSTHSHSFATLHQNSSGLTLANQDSHQPHSELNLHSNPILHHHPPSPREELKHSSQEFDPNRVVWLPNDPQNPQSWSNRKKWILTLICGLITINATFASSAPASATEDIVKHFGVSTEVATLVTSLFLCGYIAGPLIWAPLSELIGRRPVFIGTMVSYVILQLGEALNTNLHTILIIRFLSGVTASAPLTNCGGLIADIWDPIHRAPAISIFTASAFIGPVLGPIVGSFVAGSYLGFRWIFWLMMIVGGGCLAMVFFGLPETYAPILLAKRAKQRRLDENRPELYSDHERDDFSLKGILHRTLLRPFKMLASEPILVLVTVYLSIVYGLLYGLFEAFPIIWGDIRGFTPTQIGLLFIGVGIGTTLGAIINIYLQQSLKTLVPKWHGHPPCEVHLYGSMLAGPFLVVGIFWLGWTGAYGSIPWWIPALSTVFLGASFTLVFISSQSYLIDVYLMYSASALAANTICRSAFGAAFPLFTRQMFEGLGVQWAATLIGCVSLLISPSPFIFYKFGSKIRTRSEFAPNLDLQMKTIVEEEEEREKLEEKKTQKVETHLKGSDHV